MAAEDARDDDVENEVEDSDKLRAEAAKAMDTMTDLVCVCVRARAGVWKKPLQLISCIRYQLRCRNGRPKSTAATGD